AGAAPSPRPPGRAPGPPDPALRVLTTPWCGESTQGSVPTPRRDFPRPDLPANYGSPASSRSGLGAGRGLQGLGAVGALPGELRLLAAEVAVGRGLLEDRAVQVEVLAEGAGAHVELRLHQLGGPLGGRLCACG